MDKLDKETQKQIFKEVLNEWLDDKFRTLGKWTLGGIAALGFAVLLTLAIKLGWEPL